MENVLVSAVVITYKQEQYIKQTLDSVFAQDYDNLEIVITDDNSPDSTFSIIQEYVRDYTGPHKVIINQNVPNLGIAGNVNKGVALSHGEVICLFDGDDISLPNRVSKSVKLMQENGVEGGTLNMEYINKNSRSTGFYVEPIGDVTKIFGIKDYLSDNYITGGAARMFSRKLADFFGPLNEDCLTEDSTYMFRTFLMGGAVFNYEPLVKYRIHDNNISNYHSLKTRFDPVKIYNQYQKDLNLAFDKSIITIQEKNEIQSKINLYKKSQVAIREVYLTKGFLNRVIKALSYYFKPGYTLLDIRSYIGLVRYWSKTNV